VLVEKVRSIAGYLGIAPHAVRGLVLAGVVAPVRPDRVLGMLAGLTRSGLTAAASSALGAARHPDRAAVIDDVGALSYAELEAGSAAVAGALHDAHGIGPGRTVGLLCRNHRWFVVGALATARLGADLVLLNTESAAPQLGAVLQREKVDLLVLDEEFIERADAAGHTGPRVLAWRDTPDTARTTDPAGLASTLATLVTGSARAPRAAHQGKIVIMTSGTTGTPKGASRQPDAFALFGPMASMLTRVPVRAGEPMLLAPPAFHALGLAFLMVGLFLGAPVILQRRFDPARAVEAMREHRAGSMIAVPVMLARILELPEDQRRPLPHLRAVVSGASALSPGLAAAFMDAFGDVVHNLYGSSEVAWASLATPRELRSAPGTVGRPPHGTTVRVLDGDGNDLPRGQVGRIFVGSGLAFEGYTGGGSKENVRGLLATGDLGHLDGRGLLFVDGRDDDMIVSGGENVFPQEVEDCIAAHPGVAEAAVIGVSDEKFGQRLAAFVVPRPDASLTEDDVKDHVRAHLARYKVPREVTFTDQLPRNAIGKVLRRNLGADGSPG
jgi:acyl-CoA synthetase (AMP-forming)/AMP-acid ligase II